MALKLAEPYLLNILNDFNTKNEYPKNSCLQCSRSAALDRVKQSVNQVHLNPTVAKTESERSQDHQIPKINNLTNTKDQLN